MRRHIPLIGIALAVAVAIAALIAGARVPGAGSAVPSAASTAPAGRANAGEPIGMIDAATLQREIATLERAHNANPSSLRITLGLGDTYYLAQEFNKAAECYRDALRRRPGHPSAVVRMAMVWHAQSADAKAVKAIQGVIQALPDNQEARYDLAIIYFSMQDVRAARTEWVTAARIDPDSELGRASQNFVDLLASQGETPAPEP